MKMDCIMFLNILCCRTAKFKSFRILTMSTFIKIDRKIRNLKIKRHYRVKKKTKEKGAGVFGKWVKLIQSIPIKSKC